MKYLFFSLLFSVLLSAQAVENIQIVKLAKTYKLYAGSKASIQWERVFSSERHLKRYRLDTISEPLRTALKIYLIEHAADSDQPIVPGL